MTWSRQQRHYHRGRPKPNCPLCGGKGWITFGRKCHCPQQASMQFYRTGDNPGDGK